MRNKDISITTNLELWTKSLSGVAVLDNPRLHVKELKPAIVVMSFGTTIREARQKNIEATFVAIKLKYPNIKIELVFTSQMIINRIRDKEGINYQTPVAVIEQLINDGYTHLAVIPFDIVPGIEYNNKLSLLAGYRDNFVRITCGKSLLYFNNDEVSANYDDVDEFIRALATQFREPKFGEAVLIMAHGTSHQANNYYSLLQERINKLGYRDCYIYTVEGTPSVTDIIPSLRVRNIQRVYLVPMMLVAGRHVIQDMIGNTDATSHKNILEANGYEVVPQLQGLGENQAIRNLYVKRLDEAWSELIA